ncbi:MAG TPA: phosphate signaling complex protein PhoU [Desulfosporosinus sp.]|nr:phosphate signaling complex protein PhoU [Desulfosporosinus sp.]
MPTRQKFDDDLEELRLNILELGKMVDDRIGLAVSSMVNQDLEVANSVVVGDLAVNDLQAIIESKCILLIATQQPFARDLRKLVAGFKISIYLERMADLSVDLAKITLRIGRDKFIKPLIDIPKMGALVQDMLNSGLRAYIQEDCDAASMMAQMDDEVDRLYAQVYYDLQVLMMEDPNKVTQANYLLFAGRFTERMGDYCTNIAEEIVYLCSGKRVYLNE